LFFFAPRPSSVPGLLSLARALSPTGDGPLQGHENEAVVRHGVEEKKKTERV
jgi:hypothetical protein